MFSYIDLALVSLVLYLVLRSSLSLQRNIAIAKASGFPYVVIPFSELGVVWGLVVTSLIYPVLNSLPYFKNCTWVHLRKYIDLIGDVYLVVSPSSLHLSSTNAEFNVQIAARRTEFEKPVEAYTVLKQFGRNLLSSDGSDWRRQRKIIAPSFSEKSNEFVWETSLTQGQSMLKSWAKREGNFPEDMKVSDTAPETATLTLHVICGAGFGVPQIWPHEDEAILGSRRVAGFNTAKLTEGHKLTFKTSLRRTIGIKMFWLAVLPHWFLRVSPLQMHRTVILAYDECRQYFNKLFEQKRRLRQLELEDRIDVTMDLMGPLIKASDEEVSRGDGLNEDEIMGNSFIFLLAGHETSANTLHYCMLFLALNRAAQSHLQSDIDSIVGSRPVSEWSYEVDMRNLYNSMLGAALNETLRLMPPVVRIPKINRDTPKTVTIDGKTFTIPTDTFIHLNVVGTGRNPKYYPHSLSKVTSAPTDMDDFVPERWLLDGKANGTASHNSKASLPNAVDGLENVSFEMQGSLFRPAKGAYIPFSDGARACPGRRFAQVEITAALSVIFKFYSVELDVSAWASDEEVKRMKPKEKIQVYGKAQQRARELIRGSIPIISLQMHGDPVPVRFVKRGRERFGGLGL